MAEQGQAKVEQFKLSKDQIAWVKAFQQVSRIGEALQQKMQFNFGELESTQRLFREVSGKKAELLKLAPTDKLKELPGQEDASEDFSTQGQESNPFELRFGNDER